MIEPGRQRQFHIHHCLGRGGYGEVYRATMVSPGGLRTDVAVKLLRVDVDPGDEAVRRLRDEGRMLAALRHPAILRVYDLALLEGRVGLVTEYVEGQDLSALGDRIPPRALLEVVGLVAEALDVAWSHVAADGGQPLRLVHRDVKPSNVRVGRHGEVKLLDFGIARSTREEVDREAKTGTGSTVGSLAYMAPERFTRTPITPAADVFGLGCTLYEGLVGRRVFEEAVPVEMFRLASDAGAFGRHIEERLARLPPDTDPELVGLLRRMLAHAAAERPSAAEVRAACEALEPRAPGDPLRKWARAREWPPPPSVHGFLDGRTITEGTLTSHDDRAGATAPGDERSSETFRVDLPPAFETDTQLAPIAGVTRSRAALAAIGVALALLAIGGVAWLGLTRDEPPRPAAVAPVSRPPPAPVAVAPAPPPAPVASSAVPAPPAPAPVVAPSPRVERPRPRPAPAPAPPPEPEVEPAPVVEPEPPPPPRFGEVRVTEMQVPIELHGASGHHRPGRVPIGRYELFADFGRGFVKVGRVVDVLEDHVTTVKCNPINYKCDVVD